MQYTKEENAPVQNSGRRSWPYPSMEVGETVRIPCDQFSESPSEDEIAAEQRYARSYAHSCGYKNNKKFRTMRDGNDLVVTRIS